MLRLLVLLLVVANLGFHAWTKGLLDNLTGLRSQGDREPERMERQVHPELLKVLTTPPAAASSVSVSSAEVPLCLEAGPYTAAQIGAAEDVLQTVMPAANWINVKHDVPAVWIVYMGKYPNRETLQKKLDELRRRLVTAEEVNSPAEFEGGLSLGRFDSRAAAEKALESLFERGVRTARVVPLTRGSVNYTLRVERATIPLQTRLAGLYAESLLAKPFTACVNRG